MQHGALTFALTRTDFYSSYGRDRGCGGGNGKGTCVPRLKNVNHRYSILRWRSGEAGKLLEDCTEILESVGEDVDA